MLDRALALLWERSAMRCNQWHSPRTPWYPDNMSPWVCWHVCRAPAGPKRPSSGRLGYVSGLRVWYTNGLRASCWLRELTAREPLTRMAQTGFDSDGPCAQGTDRI
jgi:hypothetical protein